MEDVAPKGKVSDGSISLAEYQCSLDAPCLQHMATKATESRIFGERLDVPTTEVLKPPRDTDKQCAVNGCKNGPDGKKGLAIRACHVISANQNADSGVRKIVYMCASHNGLYKVHTIRSNAITHILDDCDCGEE